jgi:hypothetical protein
MAYSGIFVCPMFHLDIEHPKTGLMWVDEHPGRPSGVPLGEEICISLKDWAPMQLSSQGPWQVSTLELPQLHAKRSKCTYI